MHQLQLLDSLAHGVFLRSSPWPATGWWFPNRKNAPFSFSTSPGTRPLERWRGAHRLVALVHLDRLGHGGLERSLRLAHGLVLGLGRSVVIAAVDGLGLRHLAGLLIDDHLGERIALRGVHRKLQLAVLDLVLRRDGRPLALAGRHSTLERNFGILHLRGEVRLLLRARRQRESGDERGDEKAAHGTLLPPRSRPAESGVKRPLSQAYHQGWPREVLRD